MNTSEKNTTYVSTDYKKKYLNMTITHISKLQMFPMKFALYISHR